MRYLLDTNIISHVLKPRHLRSLLRPGWLSRQMMIYSSPHYCTLAEIRRGILEKPAGRRRDQLESWFAGPEGPQVLFAGRVLPFDEKAAILWARLMADGKAKDRPRSALDTIIASIAEANECVVVTDDEKDFADVQIVNPLRESER